MDINYVMAIDPGKATGVAFGRYSVEMPMEVIFCGIIRGGAYGFAEWLYNTHDGRSVIENDCSYNFPENYDSFEYHLDIVCENFKPRGTSFIPDLEPLRIEGIVMDHFGSIVNWHAPSDKSLIGDEFLKEHGLWQTGKDVDHTDGRDANDAIIHLFAHAVRLRHIPTLETYWRK